MAWNTRRKTLSGATAFGWVSRFQKPLGYLLAILAVVGGFFWWKHKKSQPVDMEKEANKVVPNKNLQKIAREIAHHLGTAYSLFDPRHWTENDDEVFKILEPLTQSDFDQVAKLYAQVYSKGSDLRADLLKLLDSKLQEQLTVL